jgi:tripartite-type tricarboxylate transporter receptor subunit TctC
LLRRKPDAARIALANNKCPLTGAIMKIQRRRFLQLSALAAALPAAPGIARAEAYPSHPVHIVLGFPPGGSSDVIGRLMAQSLAQKLGKPFVFDNKPGAGGNIGTEWVAKAAADGYTLLMSTSANAINATLYRKLNFNFLKDFESIAGVFQIPNVMEVNPSIPVKSVPEFIAYAKANPGKINFASGGLGTTSHMAGELFKFMTGVDIRHVPYRGSAPALIDLLSGQVQAMFDLMPASIGFIRAGKLRPLAVTTAQKSPALPDLPTVGQFVPGYEVSTWNGVSAPKGTPPEIVERLNKEINASLADPKIKARLTDLGATGLPETPAAFATLVAQDTERWAKVVKFAHISAD